MQLRFTRNAGRNRIGKAHALHVMASTQPTISTNARLETEYQWVGMDDRGVELEIAAVEIGDTLLVLHVMPARYRQRR